ncbi:MAG: alpha/beta hydrolase [Candidatus Binatia bacterium]
MIAIRNLLPNGSLWLAGLISIIVVSTAAKRAGAQDLEVETAVCGSLREPFMFWLWRTMAGSSDPERVAQVRDLERLQFRTRDGIVLGGYKLAAADPKGFLLIALGNAMLADRLVADVQVFREAELDTYIFDYRGYGMSEGKSRLAAIVDDYGEIIRHLHGQGYQQQFLYGISMGGIILLNAVSRGAPYTRMVVDGSPSRISWLGCPERYDPVLQLPEESGRIMIISGARDRVVKPAEMEEMLQVAEQRGARVIRDAEFAHPYQDASAVIHRRRQQGVISFLLQE